MSEATVLLTTAAAIVAVCAAPILFVLWRTRSRVWVLEQRLLRLESVAERLPSVEGRTRSRVCVLEQRLLRLESVAERLPSVEDRVSRVAGVLEFFASDDPAALNHLRRTSRSGSST